MEVQGERQFLSVSALLIFFQVLLQAMKEDPPLDAKCRDKFLVQSVPITPERDVGNISAIVSLQSWSLGAC